MTWLGMDNFALRVVGAWDQNGDDHLVRTLSLALEPMKACAGWAERDGTLFLFWTIEGATDAHPFPAPIANIVQLHGIVAGWLERHPPVLELTNGSAVKEMPTGFGARP